MVRGGLGDVDLRTRASAGRFDPAQLRRGCRGPRRVLRRRIHGRRTGRCTVWTCSAGSSGNAPLCSARSRMTSVRPSLQSRGGLGAARRVDGYGAGDRRRMLQLIGDETERLDRLVGNLLSLARIEGGGTRPETPSDRHRRTPPRQCTTARPGCSPATRVRPRPPADLPFVHADHTLLEQVVDEPRRERGPAQSADGDRSRSSCSVARRRSSTRRQPMRARRFTGGCRRDLSSRSGRATTAGASGIGLAICRAVVEAHGGTIAVGESPRGGASFTVTLPVR